MAWPEKELRSGLPPGIELVGMIGDGINDTPALATADVSFAMRSGSDIAIEAADITLMRNDLMSAMNAISLSRATLKKTARTCSSPLPTTCWACSVR